MVRAPMRLPIAYLQLAISMILVGATLPISKAALAWVPPVAIAGMRFTFITLLLIPVAWSLRRAMPRRAEWISLAMLALFGMVLFNMFLLYGLQGTSAVTAGIVTSTIPAATAVLAALMLGERMGAAGIVAVLLAVAGIAALNLQSATASGTDTLWGNALILAAVVSEALYGIYARRLGGKLPPLLLTFLANMLAAGMMIPILLAVPPAFDPGAVPLRIWLLLAAAALTGGLVSIVLWVRGVAHVPAGRAGLFTGLLPAASVLVAVLFLDEPFAWGHALGLGCVLLSIALGTGAIGIGKPPAVRSG